MMVECNKFEKAKFIIYKKWNYKLSTYVDDSYGKLIVDSRYLFYDMINPMFNMANYLREEMRKVEEEGFAVVQIVFCEYKVCEFDGCKIYFSSKIDCEGGE